MLKINKLLDYALLVTVTLAKNENILISAPGLSEETGLNIPTVRKLLNMLTIAGVVKYKRETDNGYALAKSSKETKVLDVVNAVETQVSLTECCSAEKSCYIAGKCTVRSYWKVVNKQILGLLSDTSIYEIANNKEDK
tara:strand:- start:78 stop:491 length:414 start_codon:yes stop_codon:yes gene_type:complete